MFRLRRRRLPKLAEYDEVLRLAESWAAHAQIDVLAQIKYGREQRELLGFSFGSRRPEDPVLILVGGVHGLERIGTHILISVLAGLRDRWSWDKTLQWQLEKLRIVIVPLLNPVGMALDRRSNGNGVDLMRNAPVMAPQGASFLIGGQRVSKHLPWFMGAQIGTEMGTEMEVETSALCKYLGPLIGESRLSVALDLHSGFGAVDQLWFPYAHSVLPFPDLAEVYALKLLLDRAQPYHVYRFEPQARNYTTHGDLWDHLYLSRKCQDLPGRFLPLTLEMGSWSWIRKNPVQLFSFLGPFNPIKPHRYRRTLRRHLPLFEFFIRALLDSESWALLGAKEREKLEAEARALWYSTSIL